MRKLSSTLLIISSLLFTGSTLGASFPLYRDFKNNNTSCQCNYLKFIDSNRTYQRMVVDLGSPFLLTSATRFNALCKNKTIFQFLYGTPPPFKYCLSNKSVRVFTRENRYQSLSRGVMYHGLATPKLEIPLAARGIIGLAPYSNVPQFGMMGAINQMHLHQFSFVFPNTDKQHGYFFTHSLPKKYHTGSHTTLKLIGLKSPVTQFGYFVKVKQLSFHAADGKTITLTNTDNGLMYRDATHPKGVKVGTALYAVIDNGNSNFPEFFRYNASPISTDLETEGTYVTSHGKAPESVTIILEDARGKVRRIYFKVPSSVKWAFATPDLKQFMKYKTANIPLAFNFALPFLEHFNLNFSLNEDYTEGTVQFFCKDHFCRIN